jgi:branched-chain amino acid transport system ATP-binding protein
MLAEQHAELALSLTKNVIVLDRGRVVHASDSKSLLSDPAALQRLVAMP